MSAEHPAAQGRESMDWLRRFTEKWGWYTPGSAKAANDYLAEKEHDEGCSCCDFTGDAGRVGE